MYGKSIITYITSIIPHRKKVQWNVFIYRALGEIHRVSSTVVEIVVFYLVSSAIPSLGKLDNDSFKVVLHNCNETRKLHFRHFWLRTLPLYLSPRFDSLMVKHLDLSYLSSMSSFQKMENGGFCFLNIYTILSWKCQTQSSNCLIFRGFCHCHKLNHGHKLWYSVFVI